MKKRPLSNLLLFQNDHRMKFLNIMRISTFFLFLCIFSAFASKTVSQNAKVSIKGSNLTIAEFIDQIEGQQNHINLILITHLIALNGMIMKKP